MTPRFIFSPLVLLVLFIVAGSVFVTYAFASTNAQSSPTGGEGLSPISGYDVTNISYHSGDNPSRIDSVSFTLNAAANIVKIKLLSSQSNWYDCNSINSVDWICETTGASVKSVDQLTVVASNK
jgi:hypothetical protein